MVELKIPIIKSKDKMHDPYYVKRTDAMDDIDRKNRKKDRRKLDKIFGIVRKPRG